MKFSQRYPRGEGDARKLNTHIVQRKCAVPHSMTKNMTCVTFDNGN